MKMHGTTVKIFTYLLVYLKTIIKHINKELVAHTQRCTEAEIYLIASLANISAVRLKICLIYTGHQCNKK
jgi:hypothetical protein